MKKHHAVLEEIRDLLQNAFAPLPTETETAIVGALQERAEQMFPRPFRCTELSCPCQCSPFLHAATYGEWRKAPVAVTR